MKDSTTGKVLSRSLSKAGIEDGAVADTIRKGQWQLERDKRVAGAPKKGREKGERKFRLTEGEKENMIRDKAGGASNKNIARKYGLSERYVENAMAKNFVSTAAGASVLKGVLLEGAIATGMRVQEKLHELTGAQSVIATTALTAKFIDLDKHTAAQKKVIDFDELTSIGDDLRSLRAEVGDDMDEPGIIDIEAIVVNKKPKKKKKLLLGNGE